MSQHPSCDCACVPTRNGQRAKLQYAEMQMPSKSFTMTSPTTLWLREKSCRATHNHNMTHASNTHCLEQSCPHKQASSKPHPQKFRYGKQNPCNNVTCKTKTPLNIELSVCKLCMKMNKVARHNRRTSFPNIKFRRALRNCPTYVPGWSEKNPRTLCAHR